jgi:AraC-like DNA-binding protein
VIERGFALAERSTLAIWLTPKESATIAPRLSGRVRILDIPNLAALNEALAAGRADAVLASAARLDARCVEELARVRRAYPGVPLFGLVTHDVCEGLAWRAATLGRLGAEVVADLSASSHGWPSIDAALDRLPGPLFRRVMAATVEALGGKGTPGWFDFLRAAFVGEMTTVKAIALARDVSPQSVYARFARAGLPGPRRYLTVGLLARAAYIAESTTCSIIAISRAANASSPQALHALVRRHTGLKMSQWLRDRGLRWLLSDYRERLIEPYSRSLMCFDPFEPTKPNELRERRARVALSDPRHPLEPPLRRAQR